MKINKKEVFEFLVISFILVRVFVLSMGKAPFVSDESMWISRSNYFELYFTGDFRPIIHDTSPSIAMGMPIIPEFVVGFSRWMGGYRPSDLNKMYSFGETYEQNKADGNVPSDGLLWWSRLLPSLMGATSFLIFFYLIKDTRNRIAGYACVMDPKNWTLPEGVESTRDEVQNGTKKNVQCRV